MLAILGHLITTAGNRLPGDIAYDVPFASIKSGLAAFDSIPAAGSLQLVGQNFLLSIKSHFSLSLSEIYRKGFLRCRVSFPQVSA